MDEILIPKTLTTLDEKILSYESIISYQKAEIFKTEKLVLEFQTCLQLQINALKMFSEEKNRLIAERDNTILANSGCEVICLDIQNKDNRDVVKCGARLSVRNMKRNSTFKTESPKNKRPSLENGDHKKCVPIQVNGVSDTTVTQLLKTDARTVTIQKILSHNADVFIGGSKGLLLRYTVNGALTYQTDTASTIVQLEIIKHKERKSLVAFTNTKIIIYEDIDNLISHRDISLAAMGYVYNDGSVIYVPIKDGEIQKLNAEDLTAAHYTTLRNGEVRSYVPGFENSKFSLISFKDSLLYRATKTNTRIQNVELIAGITQVKRIMRVGEKNFLYYTEDTIYFRNSTLQCNDTLTFERGIKFVEVSESSWAVVDCSNTVWVYNLTELGFIDNGFWKHKVSGEVTSLSLTPTNVYLSIGNEIFVFEYKL